MIKRLFLAALIFASPPGVASAQETDVSVAMIGAGAMSCARWRSTPQDVSEGAVWIYGFWTGLNYVAAASDQGQAKIDDAAILAEVRKTCAAQPSQALASAVWATYLRSEKSRPGR